MDINQFSKIRWCQVMKQPVESLQGWSDVFSKGSSGDDMGSCVLDQLEFME